MVVTALSLITSLTAACSQSTPEAQAVPTSQLSAPTPTAEPTASTRSHAGEAIALSARALPAKWTFDGSIADWSVDPKRNVVVVGIDSKKVVLAIAWAEDKPPVLSLALASPVPMLPSIGWSQRGGSTHELTPETCQFEQIPLIEAGWDNGRAHPPEVVEACLGILARYEKQTLEYRERFIRRLRVEGSTVSLVDGAGHASPFAGAIVKVQATSAEVELPLTALPDLTQAPLASLSAAAVFGEAPDTMRQAPLQPHPSSDEKPPPTPGWTRLELAAPIAFGPQPDVLAAVFVDASGVMNGGIMSQLSYSPAKPEVLSTISVPDVAVAPSKVVPKVAGAIGGPTAPDRPALLLEDEPLFETLETHGKVTVGRARGTLMTIVGGKLVAQGYVARPEAMQRRGDDLHLFQFDAGGFNWYSGFQPPTWRAAGIKPDGKIVEIADEGPDYPGMHDAWDDDPKTFHGPEWTTFGMRGRRHGKPRSITWQWDPGAARYVVSVVPASTP